MKNTDKRSGEMKLAANVVDLNPHLMCVLCGGYLIDATTIIECLHSFCRTCIINYLENSEFCPICDVQVHKTRPLMNIRPDYNLQGLVYKMVPGLFTNEMMKRRDFYVKATLPDEEDRPTADMYVPNEKISLSLEFSPNGLPVKKKKKKKKKKKQGDVDIKPELDTPLKRYLLCPAAFTIQLLKKFIKMKFDLTDAFEIDIFHKEEVLCDKYTLMDLTYMYAWKRKKPFRFYYSIYQRTPKRVRVESTACLLSKNSPKSGKKRTKHKSSKAKSKTKSSAAMKAKTKSAVLPGKSKDGEAAGSTTHRDKHRSKRKKQGKRASTESAEAQQPKKPRTKEMADRTDTKQGGDAAASVSDETAQNVPSSTSNSQQSAGVGRQQTKDNGKALNSVVACKVQETAVDKKVQKSAENSNVQKCTEDCGIRRNGVGGSKVQKTTEGTKTQKSTEVTKVEKSVEDSKVKKSVEAQSSTAMNSSKTTSKSGDVAANGDVEYTMYDVVKRSEKRSKSRTKKDVANHQNHAKVSVAEKSSPTREAEVNVSGKNVSAKVAAPAEASKDSESNVLNETVDQCKPSTPTLSVFPVINSTCATNISPTPGSCKATSSKSSGSVSSSPKTQIVAAALEKCVLSTPEKTAPVDAAPAPERSSDSGMNTPTGSPNGERKKDKKGKSLFKNIDSLANKLMEGKVKSIMAQQNASSPEKTESTVGEVSDVRSSHNSNTLTSSKLDSTVNSNQSSVGADEHSTSASDKVIDSANRNSVTNASGDSHEHNISKSDKIEEKRSAMVILRRVNEMDCGTIVSGSKSSEDDTKTSASSSKHKKSGKHKHKSKDKDKHRKHSRSSSGEWTCETGEKERRRHHSKSKKKDKPTKDEKEAEHSSPDETKSPKRPHEPDGDRDVAQDSANSKKSTYCIANDPAMENSKRLITKIKLKSLDRPSPPRHPPPSKHRIFATKSKSQPEPQRPPLSIRLSLSGTATTVIPLPSSSSTALGKKGEPALKIAPLNKPEHAATKSASVIGEEEKTRHNSASSAYQPAPIRARVLSSPARAETTTASAQVTEDKPSNVAKQNVGVPVAVVAGTSRDEKTDGKSQKSSCIAENQSNASSSHVQTSKAATSTMLLTGGSSQHNRNMATRDRKIDQITNKLNRKNRMMSAERSKPIYARKSPTREPVIKTPSINRVISLTKTSRSTCNNGTAAASVSTTASVGGRDSPKTVKPTPTTQTLIIPSPSKYVAKNLQNDVFSLFPKSLKIYTPSSPIKSITSQQPKQETRTASSSTTVGSTPASTTAARIATTSTSAGAEQSSIHYAPAASSASSSNGSSSSSSIASMMPVKSPHLCVQSVSHLNPMVTSRAPVAVQRKHTSHQSCHQPPVQLTAARSPAAKPHAFDAPTHSAASTKTSLERNVAASTPTANGSAAVSGPSVTVTNNTNTGGSTAQCVVEPIIIPMPPAAHKASSPLHGAPAGSRQPPPAHSHVSPTLPINCSSPPRSDPSNNNTNKLLAPHSGAADEQDTPLDLHTGTAKVLSVS